MRNREATLRKLESIEAGLNQLNFNLNRGDRDACYQTIESIKNQIEQTKLYIESEPITGDELNRI